MQTIAVFGTRVGENSQEYLCPFYNELIKRNIEFIVEEKFAQELQKIEAFNNFQFKTFSTYSDLKTQKPYLFFTFGGDGTILLAITYIKDLNIPIIGINTGRLGFLASVQKNDFLENMNEFLDGKFFISERDVIEVKSNAKIDFPFALNEVTISRKETTSMITIHAEINDQFLNTFWADGLIVATPTGSTAYSLSCGGPIISPDSSNFVLTPIAPHNLNVRPILLKNNCEIKLKMESRVPEYSLTLDSRIHSLKIDDEIVLKKANFTIKIGTFTKFSYFNTLREKLHWGNDLRNKAKKN